jgi:hypothetical protein
MKGRWRSLDELPLFATDEEIARAIVGDARAKEWQKNRLPTLAGKPGFPSVDAFHGGRPTWLVRRFYEVYLGVAGLSGKPGVADGPEDPSAWRRKRK